MLDTDVVIAALDRADAEVASFDWRVRRALGPARLRLSEALR